MQNISWKDVLHYGAALGLVALGALAEMGLRVPGVTIDPVVCFTSAAGIFAAGLKGGVTSGNVVKSLIFIITIGFALSFGFPAFAASAPTTDPVATFIAKLQAVPAEAISGAVQGINEADADAGTVVNASTGDVKDPIAHACYPAQIKFLQSLPTAKTIATPFPFNVIVLNQFKRDFIAQVLSGSIIPPYLKLGCSAFLGSEIAILGGTLGLVGLSPTIVGPIAALQAPAAAALATVPLIALTAPK